MEHTLHLKAGRLTDALASLQAEIRRKPDDPGLRLALFQLLCVQGHWTRAHAQLGVLAGMGPQHQIFARMFEPLVTAEIFRQEVFAGRRSPLILGEPPSWITGLVQALAMDAQGQGVSAAKLRESAMNEAPAQAGLLNGLPFAWVADADARLGPVLEAVVDRKYYWIPLMRISEITTEPPRDMRDLVWIAAHFTWQGGGESDGFIPVRYPGTEASADDAGKLSRVTTWQEESGGLVTGLGQRLLATDSTDCGILEVRALKLEPAPTS